MNSTVRFIETVSSSPGEQFGTSFGACSTSQGQVEILQRRIHSTQRLSPRSHGHDHYTKIFAGRRQPISRLCRCRFATQRWCRGLQLLVALESRTGDITHAAPQVVEHVVPHSVANDQVVHREQRISDAMATGKACCSPRGRPCRFSGEIRPRLSRYAAKPFNAKGSGIRATGLGAKEIALTPATSRPTLRRKFRYGSCTGRPAVGGDLPVLLMQSLEDLDDKPWRDLRQFRSCDCRSGARYRGDCPRARRRPPPGGSGDEGDRLRTRKTTSAESGRPRRSRRCRATRGAGAEVPSSRHAARVAVPALDRAGVCHAHPSGRCSASRWRHQEALLSSRC